MNNNLEINNNINLENSKSQEVTYENQKKFLETNLGQVINGGIDLGLKALLPDIIEDEVIEIKDSIITDGFSAGIKTAINNVVDMGKGILGIFTGKFENMSQVKSVIEKGGLIDSISDILDWGINKAKENDLIEKNTANLIKKGKNTILNTVNNNIENNITSQMESVEKVDKYIEKWNEYYKNQDFTNMEKQYNKLENELEKIMPLENTIIKARVVENLHNLIKNNGKNFNLSKEELELANKLI
ncbi:MAG: hypothetical protein IJB90_00975 [Clostridia bacterium]|nr:hypothetical protein [Clostridia bacterium]